MSESYTVSEAADILGIASERIWELVARGVLAGESQADGSYRVRLKADPAPVAEASTSHARPPNGNGNGDPSFEWRAFRELLTEFRTLTERYGQALLALGEARGEVASLRGRVEQLETRMEVRPPASGLAAWQASRPDEEDLPVTETGAEPEGEPVADVAIEPEPRVDDQPEPAVSGADVEAEPAPAVDAEPEPVTVQADVGLQPEPAYADLAAESETPDLPELAEAPVDSAPHEPGFEEAPPESRASFAIADDDVPAEPAEGVDERPPVEEPEPTEEGSQERQRIIRRHRLAATLRRRQRARSAAMAGFAEALARAEDPTTQLLPRSDVAGELLEIEPAQAHEGEEAAAAASRESTAPGEPWTPPSAEAEELELEMGAWQAPTEPERQAERASEPEPEPEAERQSDAESRPDLGSAPEPQAETSGVARDDSELRAYMSASMPDDVDPIEWVERILSPSISRAPEAPLAEEGLAQSVPDELWVAAASEEGTSVEEAAVEEAPADEQLAEHKPLEHESDELNEPAPARPLSQLPGLADLEAALEELRRSSRSSPGDPPGDVPPGEESRGAESPPAEPPGDRPHEQRQRDEPAVEEPPDQYQPQPPRRAPAPDEADRQDPGLRASHPATEVPSELTAGSTAEFGGPSPGAGWAGLLDDAEFRRRLVEPGDRDWLRGRRGPAASAYRRLRRIFPG